MPDRICGCYAVGLVESEPRMHLYPVLSGILCLAIWLYLLLAHGGFWRVERLLVDEVALPDADGLIAVVIPARNEAEGIGRTIDSLLRQSCRNSLRIFVIDDHSTDGTAEIALGAGSRSAHPGTLTVIPGRELPLGWTGKLWAVQQGIDRAMELNPRFLLLTDADIEHSPDNLATLAAVAESGPYDLASFMVKLHCQTLAERMLIPSFVFFFLLLYPPRWIADPRHKLAGAAGGCMLVRPEALLRSGGMEGIRGAIIDDCALARAVKRSGGRVWLGLTSQTHSTRVYGRFAEIEQMIARTAFNQLHHSAWILAGAVVGLFITYLAPLLLLLSGRPEPMILGGTACLLMLLAYLPMVRFYGLNPLWALTLPASACFYMAATVHSALKFWSGRGGEWKGRAQDIVRD